MQKIILGLIFLLLFSTHLMAMDRFDIITTLELQELIEQRESGKIDFLLINTLDKLIANHHSIPGSVNIPWNQIPRSQDLLKENRDRPIITYCMGYR